VHGCSFGGGGLVWLDLVLSQFEVLVLFVWFGGVLEL